MAETSSHVMSSLGLPGASGHCGGCVTFLDHVCTCARRYYNMQLDTAMLCGQTVTVSTLACNDMRECAARVMTWSGLISCLQL
jgi:hypothetical protein